LNHPFHTQKGTVGKAIAGVEIKIADDGEILVRGDNVTSGYLNASQETAQAFQEGWFHTGDIGSLDDSGRLYVRGRKKEMIVTPEGLNVFPEDIERVLNGRRGVRDSAVVGVSQGGQERVHAVLTVEPGADVAAIVRDVNRDLEDHQKIRGYSLWPNDELPRTEGTRKLKRREVQQWVTNGDASARKTSSGRDFRSIVAEFVPGRELGPDITLEELGLTSLERVELLMALERRFDTTIDEAAFTMSSTMADLGRLVSDSGTVLKTSPIVEPVDFPEWTRSRWAHWVRRINLPLWILPLARIFTWVRVEGRENLDGIEPPVIFAPNHQSHLDVPALMQALPAKWRYLIAPAMSKEFFHAHFFPAHHTRHEWFTNSLNYYLAGLVFNAFPFPQREAGARQALRYAGELVNEGWCIVIFPEGKITDEGEIAPFQPGVGMMASRLNVPVVPVRLEGLTRVLHRTWRMAKPGRVHVHFGKPLRLQGEDYAAMAGEVERVVRQL
jgi:long-chain acyl-CoA synthetase